MNYETVRRNAPRGPKRRDNSEYLEKKAKIVEIQKNNIKTITAVCKYLDDKLIFSAIKPEEHFKFKIADVIAHVKSLSEDPAYTDEALKAVSQFTYLLIELANAHLSKWIDGYRINLRIAYIDERLKTIMKRELHDDIDNLISTYSVLFGWCDVPEEKDKEAEVTDVAEEASPEE